MNVLDMAAFRTAKEQLSAAYIRPGRISKAQALRRTGPDPTVNVVGVGIGEKIQQAQSTGILSVKILVQHKFPRANIEPRFLLPDSISGLPVDIDEVGLIMAFAPGTQSPRSRMRPARPGASIGFKDPTNRFKMAGTFGALVRNASGVFVLSNNHVLADENQLPLNSPIFQPGLLDGGVASTDTIASLTRMIPLRSTNSVDCAIAKINSTNLVSSSILQIGPPTGVAAAAMDMLVHKFGRTTSYTAGRVTSVDTDVKVQYDKGVLAFKSQIVIAGTDSHAFSAAGDSGSLILERSSGKAIGLLFAGGTTATFANHIQDVLRALSVTLIVGQWPPQPSPSASPSTSPSATPSTSPSAPSSRSPSASPSTFPSASPSASPSAPPSASPSASPSAPPSASPSASPSAPPSASASASPLPHRNPHPHSHATQRKAGGRRRRARDEEAIEQVVDEMVEDLPAVREPRSVGSKRRQIEKKAKQARPAENVTQAKKLAAHAKKGAHARRGGKSKSR